MNQSKTFLPFTAASYAAQTVDYKAGLLAGLQAGLFASATIHVVGTDGATLLVVTGTRQTP